MNNKKVWLVTGASKGLGLALTLKLLAEGYAVAGTSRDGKALAATVDHSSFLPLEVSITQEASVQQAIDATIARFGRIDVVVNNAGYGHFGTLEELSDEESRQNFDINVFGSLNVIRKVMPHFRAQGSGHIFNISSIGGYTANFAGWGIYCATKFAVAGFTEALAEESKAFGIRATVVYPGYFRTEFLSGDSMIVPQNPIAAYETARASQALHQQEINGNQAGDPDKAAAVLIEVAEAAEAPVHLFLGQDAYERVALKNDLIQKDMAAWSKQATATAFQESMA